MNNKEIKQGNEIEVGHIISFSHSEAVNGTTISERYGVVMEIMEHPSNPDRVTSFYVYPIVRDIDKLSNDDRPTYLTPDYVERYTALPSRANNRNYYIDPVTVQVANHKGNLGMSKPNQIKVLGDLQYENFFRKLQNIYIRNQRHPAGERLRLEGLGNEARTLSGPQGQETVWERMPESGGGSLLTGEQKQELKGSGDTPNKREYKKKARYGGGNRIDLNLSDAVKLGYLTEQQIIPAVQSGASTILEAVMYSETLEKHPQPPQDLTFDECYKAGYLNKKELLIGSEMEPRKAGVQPIRHLKDAHQLAVSNPDALLQYKWVTERFLPELIESLEGGFAKAAADNPSEISESLSETYDATRKAVLNDYVDERHKLKGLELMRTEHELDEAEQRISSNVQSALDSTSSGSQTLDHE